MRFFMRNRKLRGQFWQNEHGFTLIEMMVALFIVSVIMAVALPNLQAAGVRAASVGCEGNQKMIHAALTEYYLMNHHFPTENSYLGIMTDLKTEGYIDSVPECSSGGQYDISYSADGTDATVTCTVHGSLGG